MPRHRWIDDELWQRIRWYLFAGVILFSVCDLLISRYILDYTAAHGGVGAEQNPIMGRILFSWWAWPVRVGIPALLVLRHIKIGFRQGPIFAYFLYAAVVVFNGGLFYYRLHTG